MQTKRLQFIDGVVLTEDGARVGITWNGNTQWARDTVQSGIVRQVLSAPQNPETYAARLAREQNLPPGGTESTLQILRFILDFKDYLQT